MSRSLHPTMVHSGFEISSNDGAVSIRQLGLTKQLIWTAVGVVLIAGGTIAVVFQQSNSLLLKAIACLGFLPTLWLAVRQFQKQFPAFIYADGYVLREYAGLKKMIEIGEPIRFEVAVRPIQVAGYEVPSCDLVVAGPLGSETLATGDGKQMELLKGAIALRLRGGLKYGR